MFKQGTVKALVEDPDKRWCLKFERKDPKKAKAEGKSAVWYVKLMLGEPHVPKIGESWKCPVERLRKIKDRGGCDHYEEIPVQTTGDTTMIDRGGKAEKVTATEVKPEKMDSLEKEINEICDNYLDPQVLHVVLEVWKTERKTTEVPYQRHVEDTAKMILETAKKLK
jgi:hypothetical protein